jgi:protein NRD1
MPPLHRPVDSSDTYHSEDKDEFGRDIRPQPPENVDPTPDNPTYPTGSRSISAHDPVVVSSPAPNNEQVTMSPLVAANTSNNSSASFVSNTFQSQPGLDSIDPTSFDPTSPSSWELLGKMWQVTYGELPTTEQLMQYVMHLMAAGQVSATSPTSSEAKTPSLGSSFGQGQWGGQGRGGPHRGGFTGYGNNQKSWNQHNDDQTDAIVLGNNGDNVGEDAGSHLAMQENGRSTGGKMQKVGDKWVFVREQ